MASNVVIAGGGFGGFTAARTLERQLPAQSAHVTLVNDVNFMLYTPLLPGAAGGSLEPRHVVVPLREELEHTDVRLGRVIGNDPEGSRLVVASERGTEEIGYDHLIVALGSVSRTLPIPGLAEHAMGFKTIAEAIALRNRVITNLEMAETIDDPALRREYLTFVFVGGGYAGLEGLAELQDLAADAVDRYPRCRVEGLRFVLVEAREHVMSEIPAALSGFAMAELRSRGVEFRLSTTVEEVTESRVRLSGGEDIATRMVVWVAGVRPHPTVASLGLPLDPTGRIKTGPDLRVEGHENVWAIGDAAAVPDPARKDQYCPPTAQHAIRQGRVVAANVKATLGTGRIRPFRYRTLGVFVDLGRRQAVADTAGIKWRGLPAWWLARTYHVSQMPGVGRRLRLLLDWTVGLFFGHDSSQLGTVGQRVALEPLLGSSAGGTTGDERNVGEATRSSDATTPATATAAR